ncbi:28369_t:CDS:2, partial [Dentiscutata erythropus]
DQLQRISINEQDVQVVRRTLINDQNDQVRGTLINDQNDEVRRTPINNQNDQNDQMLRTSFNDQNDQVRRTSINNQNNQVRRTSNDQSDQVRRTSNDQNDQVRRTSINDQSDQVRRTSNDQSDQVRRTSNNQMRRTSINDQSDQNDQMRRTSINDQNNQMRRTSINDQNDQMRRTSINDQNDQVRRNVQDGQVRRISTNDKNDKVRRTVQPMNDQEDNQMQIIVEIDDDEASDMNYANNLVNDSGFLEELSPSNTRVEGLASTTISYTAIEMPMITTKHNQNNLKKHNLSQYTSLTLRDASNELEIALWVAHHPKVLSLAISIREAMSNEVSDNGNNNEMSSNITYSYNSIQNPPEINQGDHRMAALVKDVDGWYNSYRYKLHVAILQLAEEFSETHEWDGEEPSMIEIELFVSENVWRQVLHFYLKATDLPTLNKDTEILTKLSTFVRKTVNDVLKAQKKDEDTQHLIKKYDEYTLDLKIPTKLGIAKFLPVRDLLDC